MSRSFVATLLLALAAAPLVAQAPGRGSTQQFTPFASKPFTRSTILGSYNYKLFTDPLIQADLKLTDEQKAKIARVPDDLMAKHRDAIVREEAEVKAANEKSVALAAEVTKALDDLLDRHLSAAQRKRFNQLSLQVRGVRAFIDQEVQKSLQLTQVQLTKLGDLKGTALEKLRAEFDVPLMVQGQGSGAERVRWRDAEWKAADEIIRQFVATFSDEQKAMWKELRGEPCSAAAKSSDGYPGLPDPPPSAIFTWGSPFSIRMKVINTDAIRAELGLDGKASKDLMTGWDTVLRDAVKASITPTSNSRSQLGEQILSETWFACSATFTAAQTTRMEQINFQLGRLSVLRSGYWANKLHLTPAQVTKIESVMAETARKTQALPMPSTLTTTDPARREAAQAERTRKSIELQQAALGEIAAIFDAGQTRVWKELAGPPIDLSKLSVTPNNYFNSVFSSRQEIVSGLVRAARDSTSGGDYAVALALYDEAIRLAPGNPTHRQLKAILLSTCPSVWVRDGKQAVELMKKVMSEVSSPTNTSYSALAAAFAEVGQFDEAVKAQEKAIALLPTPQKANPDAPFQPFNPNAQMKLEYEARLKLYQDKKPYRMPEPK
jgi:tetratricopeptide (TPR) repeat protein